jgi:hypothetical protein
MNEQKLPAAGTDRPARAARTRGKKTRSSTGKAPTVDLNAVLPRELKLPTNVEILAIEGVPPDQSSQKKTRELIEKIDSVLRRSAKERGHVIVTLRDPSKGTRRVPVGHSDRVRFLVGEKVDMSVEDKNTLLEVEPIRRGRPSKHMVKRAQGKLRPLLVKLSERDFELLEQLRQSTDATSWTQVIRHALRVYAAKSPH